MTDRQKTLAGTAHIKGTGAFTGDEVTVEIHPAPENHGPLFELEQNGDITRIPVSVDNIRETENRTVLQDNSDPKKQVNFVEHLLGTLHGLGIDNAVIRCNSVEIPLIDGSASPFLQAIDEVGTVEQNADRREVVIERPMFIDDNALLMALPCETTRVTYYLDHPKDFVGKRVAQIDVTPENFRRRIGPARTFVKAEKINDLLASGAVKYKSEDQLLIVHKDHTNMPLRFADEFCYHKMLDILGDMYLAGRPIRAHFIGVRSGHFQNRKLIRKIVSEYGL